MEPLPTYQAAPLPPYSYQSSSRAAATEVTSEHVFELKNGKTPWVVLTLRSNASSAQQSPKFIEGQDVQGSLVLNLESGDPIQEIILQIRGRLITGASTSESYKFFTYSHLLWSRSMGDPNNLGSPIPKGKLSGRYDWQFSFRLPSRFSPHGSDGSSQMYRLPQTFKDKHVKASIQYDFVLSLSRKLRSDTKLQVPVVYVPSTRPSPASPLRQLAYQQRRPAPGPDADPAGWLNICPVVVRGTVFNNRDIAVKCVLSLATPLVYARGSSIPLHLTLESQDSQALDLLTSPRAFAVRLDRYVTFHPGTEQAAKKRQSLPASFHSEHSQTAAWLQPTAQTPYKRTFDGELPLSKALYPSSYFPHFSVQYSVVMMPFSVTAFVPVAGDEPAVVESVEITTFFADGPRPIVRHAPIAPEEPDMDSSSQDQLDPRGFGYNDVNVHSIIH